MFRLGGMALEALEVRTKQARSGRLGRRMALEVRTKQRSSGRLGQMQEGRGVAVETLVRPTKLSTV